MKKLLTLVLSLVASSVMAAEFPDISIADLKQAIGSKVPVRTKAKLRAAADEHMQFIAANRDRVRGYFQDPIVKYAA